MDATDGCIDGRNWWIDGCDAPTQGTDSATWDNQHYSTFNTSFYSNQPPLLPLATLTSSDSKSHNPSTLLHHLFPRIFHPVPLFHDLATNVLSCYFFFLVRFIPTPSRSRPCRPYQLRCWCRQARCHCRHCWPQPCPHRRTHHWCQASSSCLPPSYLDSFGCQGFAPCCWCHRSQEVSWEERHHRCLEQDRMGPEAR